jgi:hypothetical protein
MQKLICALRKWIKRSTPRKNNNKKDGNISNKVHIKYGNARQKLKKKLSSSYQLIHRHQNSKKQFYVETDLTCLTLSWMRNLNLYINFLPHTAMFIALRTPKKKSNLFQICRSITCWYIAMGDCQQPYKRKKKPRKTVMKKMQIQHNP